MTLPRCQFIDTRTGRRCDAQGEHDGRHSLTGWGVHAGADPDRFYPLATDLNERNDMAKQQIVTEKTAPEETADDDRTEPSEPGAKYQKYPTDPTQWTPEHDFKAFGDVAKILARAPYGARCRMHAYLVGLIAPDHQAEQDRRKEYAAKAYAAERLLSTGVPPDAYADGPVVAQNGMVGVVERRY